MHVAHADARQVTSSVISFPSVFENYERQAPLIFDFNLPFSAFKFPVLFLLYIFELGISHRIGTH